MPHQHHQNTTNKPRKKDKSTSQLEQLQHWLDSFEAVSAAVERHGDLVQLLTAGGGICKIEDFLPDFVAQGIYQTLEQFSEADWNVRGCGQRLGVVAAVAAAATEGRLTPAAMHFPRCPLHRSQQQTMTTPTTTSPTTSCPPSPRCSRRSFGCLPCCCRTPCSPFQPPSTASRDTSSRTMIEHTHR